MDLTIRPRRLRSSETLRKMVRETRMDASSLIYPLFFMDGQNRVEEIPSMPGQYRYTADRMDEVLEQVLDSGVSSVLLFGIPETKDEIGSQAFAEDGIIQRLLRRAKEKYPDGQASHELSGSGSRDKRRNKSAHSCLQCQRRICHGQVSG